MFKTYLEWTESNKGGEQYKKPNYKKDQIFITKKKIYESFVNKKFDELKTEFNDDLKLSDNQAAYLESVEAHLWDVFNAGTLFEDNSSYYISCFLSIGKEKLKILNHIYCDYASAKRYNYVDINEDNDLKLVESTRLYYYVLYEALKKYKEYFKPYADQLIESRSNDSKRSIKRRLPKRTPQNITQFTEIQMLIFIYYLRKHKIVLSNTSDTVLTENFGELIDYSAEVMRQNLNKLTSGKHEINCKGKDLRHVIDIIEEILDKMKEELSMIRE